MSVKPEDGPLAIVNLAWRWNRTADDEMVMKAFWTYLERAQDKAAELGVWHPYKYWNYAHVDQDVFEGFGEEGLEWLRKVQRDVDPKGVFTQEGLVKGGFTLNKNLPHGASGKARDEL